MRRLILVMGAAAAVAAARPATAEAPASGPPFYSGQVTNFEMQITTFSTGVLANAKGVAAGDGKHISYSPDGMAGVSVPPNPQLIAMQELASMHQTSYGYVGGAAKLDKPTSLDPTPGSTSGRPNKPKNSRDQLLDPPAVNPLTPTLQSSPAAIQQSVGPANPLDNPGMVQLVGFPSP